LQLFDPPDELDEELRKTIDYVANKYGAANESELKRLVYLTSPMRGFLRRELTLGENMFNRPIDFSVIAFD
jgi:hypothetical protein